MAHATAYLPMARPGRFRKESAAGLIALVMVAAAFAAAPVLSRLEMIGSGRGLALTLGADAPFTIALHARPADTKNTSLVVITCSNVIYGLSDYHFSVFPRGSPLKQIIARDDNNNNSVELSIKVLAPVEKNIRSKQKDNRWVILLTSAPVNDFAWSAQNAAEKNAPALGAGEERIAAEQAPSVQPRDAVPQVTAASFLEDITILHRERVEKVVFKFDAPTEMVVKSMPDQIVVLFVNSKNGLSHGTFKSEKDWLVKSIILKEVAHGGTTWLGASILINREGSAKPLVETFPDRLVIYSVRDTKQCLYLWSARSGTTLSYDFITPRQFPVDYKKIEKKALTDSKSDEGKTGTFSVGEPLGAIPPETKAAPAAAQVKRVVVIKDKVNLRAEASSAPAVAVISQLPLGAIGTEMGKKGQWLNVTINDERGWIMSAMAMDSGKVSKELWEKIEAARTALAKQEEKATPQRQQAVPAVPVAKAAPVVAKIGPSTAPVSSADSLEATARAKDTHPKPEGKAFAKLIEYQVYGRDPFLPLSEDEDGPLPNIENLQLVGILYDAMDRIGLFEDIRNKTKAYALRENDPITNGYLLRIQTDKVLFLINELGISRTYAMKLNRGKEPKAYKESSRSVHQKQ
jgi:hypothetical protein